MNKQDEKHWTCPPGMMLPDFIICGAMKCGTTTLHAILNQHPGVFIPEPEIHFFDIDDLFQHADFFSFRDKWYYPGIAEAKDDYWRWYGEFFKDAEAGQLVGEDSTCYLASSKAAERIALQPKPIKTIICLRDPVERAYSQYWHMLRTGRAMFTFEDTIRFTPDYVLARSMYLEQVKRFTRHIPRERIFFFVLERFLEDKTATLKELSDFLGIDVNAFPAKADETHANPAKFPRSLRLEQLSNRALRSFGNTYYLDGMPFETPSIRAQSFFVRAVKKMHRIINPLIARDAPSMNPATRTFLNDYLQRELAGLDEIIGVDVNQYWFQDRS